MLSRLLFGLNFIKKFKPVETHVTSEVSRGQEIVVNENR